MLTSLDRAAPWALGVFRIVVGFLFLCHGTSTLFGWPIPPYSGVTADLGAWPSWWVAMIELIGGAAIIAGVGTRIAAFIGAGAMAVAYFWKHQGDGLFPIENEGEAAALFCWSLLLLVFLGPGRPALGSVLAAGFGRKRAERDPRGDAAIGSAA